MKILFLTQYYPPETGAPQARLSSWVRSLSSAGHSLTVLTALPNYPHGVVLQAYRGRLLVNELIDNVRVVRTWIYATKSKGFVSRLLNYFSFVFCSVIAAIGTIGRQDIVVVESPPLFLGLSGWLISRLRGARLVFNVSDLWPQSAVEMGIIRNHSLIRFSTGLENFIYRHSDGITGQTLGIVQNIRSRFPAKKIALMNNGVDPETFVEASRFGGSIAKVREEFGLTQRFVVGYAGLHGLAQGLETALEAARILSRHQDIVFAFFGEGPQKRELELLADHLQLKNVCFFPNQPRSRMPEILAAFDVSLIPLRRLAVFKGALPSKMFEAMAAAIPLIVAVEGEARTLMDSAGAGVHAEPDNAASMVDAILQLYRDPALRQRLGNNGRAYVIKNFDRKDIAARCEQFLSSIYELCSGGKAARDLNPARGGRDPFVPDTETPQVTSRSPGD